MKIVLVGFMAAGKTTVGRRLAERLGWDFVDFDQLIRERTGRTAGALIREEGEAALRELEAELTGELARRSRVVLAPGGGWGADPSNAEKLGPRTVRVWLRVSFEEAVRRAGEDAHNGVDRPLLRSTEHARALFARREDAYAAAEITVDVDGKEPERVVDQIVQQLDMEAGGS